MARIGAKRDAVPPNIFLERLFKPSVLWEGESRNNNPDQTRPSDTEHSDIICRSANEITSSAHKIMAVIALWTEPFLAYLIRQELPEDQNEARCIVRGLKPIKSTKESFIRKAPPESFKGVSPKRKGGTFWLKFMPDSAGTTPQPGPL